MAATATDVEVAPWSDEHIAGRDDIDERWLAGILADHPEGERNVVAGAAVGDGEQTVETEEQLDAAIVKGWTAIGVRYIRQDQGDTHCRGQTWAVVY